MTTAEPPLIPDGMTILTDLPKVPGDTPRLRLEYKHEFNRVEYGTYIDLRSLYYPIQVAAMSLHLMVRTLSENIRSRDLVDFYRDLCRWDPTS